MVLNGRAYFTGYAVVNPNELLTVQSDVSIELVEMDGRTAADPLKVSLSPSARFAAVLDNGDALAHLPALR